MAKQEKTAAELYREERKARIAKAAKKNAKKHNKMVIAFSGCVTDDAVNCNNYGIDAFFPIVRKPCTLDEAMDCENAYKNLKDTAHQVFRLIKVYTQGDK